MTTSNPNQAKTDQALSNNELNDAELGGIVGATLSASTICGCEQHFFAYRSSFTGGGIRVALGDGSTR